MQEFKKIVIEYVIDILRMSFIIFIIAMIMIGPLMLLAIIADQMLL